MTPTVWHELRFDGDTVRIVERGFAPVPVAAAEKDSAVADRSLALVRDELDVRFVVRYRIEGRGQRLARD